MDTTPADETPRRRGVLDAAKGWIATALGATRSKVDDISAEVEYRTFRIIWMAVWGLVGITSLWLAVMLSVLTVIFGFHIPPKYAFGIPALFFLLVGLVAVALFQKTKRSRRKPERRNAVSR
jgi:uncharacterized membrane protein YuzA (DUF378 family)